MKPTEDPACSGYPELRLRSMTITRMISVERKRIEIDVERYLKHIITV